VDEIHKVFGGEPGEKPFHCGQVVFHDAWPATWPALQADLLNCHHKDYYGAPESKAPSPGDWEEPSMVSFLAVGAGQKFDFPLAKRRTDVADHVLDNAFRWLTGGLTTLGFGAKTAAGYGHFVSSTNAPIARIAGNDEFTLTLATPAFLAGPDQKDASGCQLRPATLRGQLRWWWRTLHAAHVSPADLRLMEAAVWGSTSLGGAARFTIEAVAGNPQPLVFDRVSIIRSNDLPRTPNNKTAQGLAYHSYGMNEKTTRHFLAPGCKWTLRLQARNSWVPRTLKKGAIDKTACPALSAELIAEQATAALWLLCRFGGVGSKSRKGFGNFALPPQLQSSEESCLDAAKRFREACRIRASGKCDSPSLEMKLPLLEFSTGITNYWLALDAVGMSAQIFAQGLKHDLTKKALGLPRNVGRPTKGHFQAPLPVEDRHASPIHYRLVKGADDTYSVTVCAFPAPLLPNEKDSIAMLQQLLNHLKSDLEKRCKEVRGKRGAAKNPAGPGRQAAPVVKGPKPSDRVECVLTEEKTKKGGWKAQLVDGTAAGAIQNTGDVPGDKKAGDIVTLIVKIAPPNIAFDWPK